MTLPYPNIPNILLASNTSYHLRLATLKDASEICAVMDTCFQALEQKEYFICDDLDYVKDILSDHGFGVVACNENDEIVGNLLVKYPGITEENLGYDVFVTKNIPSPTPYTLTSLHPPFLSEANLKRVLHMDSASVLPAHRGYGLEGKMIAFAESLVDTSKHCYAFATVDPRNIASLKTLEKCGYQIMVTKEKYNGFVRHVMMKQFI